MQRSLNSEPLLRLEAVRLTLMSQAGPVNILNGIDLKIGKGEAVGLVGPSGSGKSTMLMVMAGLERPTSGKVTVAGQELSKFDEDAAARFRRGNVGIVFQSFHLIPTMTALENVAVPLELAMAANAFDRAREELKAVGLAHRLDHYPSQLSGGEQQRVALARAIAPRPGILFADEPTGNLDGRTGGEIMDLMFALQRERGATLILVTHDEDLVKRCDRIVRLRDGRIDGIETIEHSSAPIFIPPSPQPVAPPLVVLPHPALSAVEAVPAHISVAPPPVVLPDPAPREIEAVPVYVAMAPLPAPVEPAAAQPVVETQVAPTVPPGPVEERVTPPAPAPVVDSEPEPAPMAPAQMFRPPAELELASIEAAPPPTAETSPVEPVQPPDIEIREPLPDASLAALAEVEPGASLDPEVLVEPLRRVASAGE